MTSLFEIIAISPPPLAVQPLNSIGQNSYHPLIDACSRSASIALAASQSGYLGIIDLAFVTAAEDLEKFFNNLLMPALLDKKHKGGLGIRISAKQLNDLNNILSTHSSKNKEHYSLVILVVPDTVSRYVLAANNSKLAESINKSRHDFKKKNFNIQIFLEILSAGEAKAAEKLGADGLIAKGYEASGLVGEQTTFVLVQECLEQVKIPIYAWGGIGLHTAAACYAAGARGVVLDSQLWLTRESMLPLAVKAKIEQFDGTESHLLPLLDNEQSEKKLGLRVYIRPNHEFILPVCDSLNTVYESVSKHNIENDPINWVIPIGQDIAFAKALSQKYLSVGGILHAIKQAVNEHIAFAHAIKPLAEGSALASSHGTKYPIVQGAMTRVSDKSQFAHAVAKEGALPFLALALMRGTEAEPLLSETQTLLSGLPWGVGILGFVPGELRQEQMAALKKYRPPYVLIAGGRPDQAKSLEELGIKTYLHVPSPLLLDSFMEMGCRRFVFEGRECGGHVGPRSSFVLWETMVEHLLNNIGPREDASAYHILFAGGIHDARSAAAVAALASPLAIRGLKIGVLMGTAYLFTEEAVNSGAIVKTFQEAALTCDDTVLLETGPGHAIRCINSPYKKVFDHKRRLLTEKGKSKEEIREELEFTNLGRLRLASKGLIRADAEEALNSDSHNAVGRDQMRAEIMQTLDSAGNIAPASDVAANKLKPIAENKQWEHGMYMIGQIASMHKTTVSINNLHTDVSNGSTHLLESLAADIPSVSTAKTISITNADESTRESVAIIGMSCLFPKAKDLHTFWRNILDKVDAIEEVPLTHWDWRNYYDADPLARDKIYSKWGGFLDEIEFDATKYGIPPGSLSSIDAMQLLLLEVTDATLKDAGYNNKPFPREKTSVILANAGHGPITAFYSLRSMLGWKLSHLAPAVKEELENMLPEWTEDTFPGYLGNVTAGRVCNRFDLGGVNFSIDAACASSLAALYTAVAELRCANSDLVFLAATDTHNQPGDYLSFSKTHALSPDGHCKTFDANANGIVISEGMAMLALKRLSDAERDGDRIYAVIRGIGGSSDGRDLSLTAPRAAGQIKALHRAYEDAAINPNSVTLIEAHGTGTVAGDKAEVEALKQVFEHYQADKHSCAIGSVKTMIGHTKAAAGLASLIKVAKSLYHKVLPPTIGVVTPNPACHFETGPFYINSETRPWLLPTDKLQSSTPRRAGVSAFGFGGTNFHAVLEEYRPSNEYLTETTEDTLMPAEVFVFNGNNPAEIVRAVASFEDKMNKLIAKSWHEKLILASLAYWQFLKNLDHQMPLKNVRHSSGQSNEENKSPACLSIVATSLLDLKNKFSSFRDQLQSGTKQIKDPRGVYFLTSHAAQSGKLAFLFPGQGSQYPNMLCDLSVRFAEVRETFASADQLLKDKLNKSLSAYIYPTPAFNKEAELLHKEALTDTRIAQPAMGAANMAALSLVKSLGIKADMMAGHSYGEYVALCAAGYYNFDNLINISAARGEILSQPNHNGSNINGAMAAVSCSPEELGNYLPHISNNISLANYNSPKQIVIAGNVEDIEQAIQSLQNQGIVARRIAVSQAFHTQSMRHAAERLSEALKKIEFKTAQTVTYSNRQGNKYDQLPDVLPAKLALHTVEPVDFVKQINNMYNDGARIFLEVGPGNVLSNLAQSILENHHDSICIPLDRQGRDGITGLLHALAQLAVNGIHIDWQRLYQHRLDNLATFLDSNTDTDAAPLKGNKKLMYMVNGVGIRPKGSDTATNITPANSNSLLGKSEQAKPATSFAQLKTVNELPFDAGNKIAARTAPTTSKLANSNIIKTAVSGSSDNSAEQIMLQFQQTMQTMANSFLETQQRVMLAFLETQGNGKISNNGSNNGQYNNLQSQPINEFSAAPLVIDNQTSLDIQSDDASTIEISAIATSPPKVDIDFLVHNLVEIVAERTGYPVDMIDPALDLEADLGIDSIKRVEILNKFRRLLPESTQQKLESGIEELAGTRTLQGIIDWLRVHQDDDTNPAIVEQTLALTDKHDGNGNYDSNGNNGHDSEIKLEQREGQQYIESTAKSPARSIAYNAATNGGNGNHNGKDGQHTPDNKTGGVIRRAIVAPVLLPKLSSVPDQLSAKMKEIQNHGQVVLITADKLGLAAALSKIVKEHGLTPVVVQSSPLGTFTQNETNSSFISYNVDLQNDELVQACLIECENKFGKIAMLFHLESFGEQSPVFNRASAISLLHLLKYASQKTEKQQRIVTVTSMGGKFGIGQSVHDKLKAELFSPVQAAVVGLIKVAAKELPTSICKAIDFALKEPNADVELENIASQIFAESVLDNSNIEVGYASGDRFGLDVVESPTKQNISKANLNRDSVVLITGGARGITAEIAFEIAKHYKPTLILIGRSDLPEIESPSYAGLTGARELKAKIIELLREDGRPVSIPHVEIEYKKLIKDREIRNNIAKLEASTSKVIYHKLDVKDSLAFAQLIERIYKEHGKIDAVVHSAGIIEDALIKDKSTESFERVFDTKVSSALTLLDSLKLDSLQYLFLFSSVVGRTGNAGQSDYVAANEVLNKLAIVAQRKMSGRAASIMWGPWRGGMAQPELEEIFAQYGWAMIGVPEGSQAFMNELLCQQKSESEVLVVAELSNKHKAQPSGARLYKSSLATNTAGNQEYIVELDTQVDKFLLDHAFDGIPVLPMAYALELMCEAAGSTYTDLPLTAIRAFDIPAGILFDSQRKKLSIIVQEKEKGKDSAIAQVSIYSGTTKRRENFRATFVMGKDNNPATIPSAVPTSLQEYKATDIFKTGSEITLPSVTEIYRQWLFHGPDFRGIKTINAASDNGIWGTISGLSPERCLNLPFSTNWIIDPVMFDSAMQLGGIWARRCLDITVLPTGFRQLQFLQAPNCKQDDIFTSYVIVTPTNSKNELSCDLAIYNQAGELCVLVEGLTGVGNKSLHRLVGQNAALKAGISK